MVGSPWFGTFDLSIFGEKACLADKFVICDRDLYRKYESGAVGSLTHAVALHGTYARCCPNETLDDVLSCSSIVSLDPGTGFNYSTEIDIYADGYSLRLVDPYNAPVLYFRRPGDDHEGTSLFGEARGNFIGRSYSHSLSLWLWHLCLLLVWSAEVVRYQNDDPCE